jgi:hypothetical protein
MRPLSLAGSRDPAAAGRDCAGYSSPAWEFIVVATVLLGLLQDCMVACIGVYY